MMASKLILQRDKYSSATQSLVDLHWLNVEVRIQHKVLTVTQKCLNNNGPQYLSDLLACILEGCYGLRSADDDKKLIVSYTKCSTFTARSFSVMAPVWWNSLPNMIRQCKDLDQFKRQLKTHLFSMLLTSVDPYNSPVRNNSKLNYILNVLLVFYLYFICMCCKAPLRHCKVSAISS